MAKRFCETLLRSCQLVSQQGECCKARFRMVEYAAEPGITKIAFKMVDNVDGDGLLSGECRAPNLHSPNHHWQSVPKAQISHCRMHVQPDLSPPTSKIENADSHLLGQTKDVRNNVLLQQLTHILSTDHRKQICLSPIIDHRKKTCRTECAGGLGRELAQQSLDTW